MKYLGLFEENLKTLLKVTKEDLKKMSSEPWRHAHGISQSLKKG